MKAEWSFLKQAKKVRGGRRKVLSAPMLSDQRLSSACLRDSAAKFSPKSKSELKAAVTRCVQPSPIATPGDCTQDPHGPIATERPATTKGAWSFLKPAKTSGKRKGLDAPAPAFRHLVVLDFEWTAQDKKPVKPVSEIIQFPSVLVRLAGAASAVVDEFDTFVRPTLVRALPAFSTELCGITQADVDAAPPLHSALTSYLAWLQRHGLVTAGGRAKGHWAFCTWSDADLGSQLPKELKFKRMEIPQCFTKWINLKLLYQRHFKHEPRGGLRACVERLGIQWRGQAHNGLADSQNTAQIVLKMARGDQVRGAFVFRHHTRGLDRHGNAFGRNKRTTKKRKRVVRHLKEDPRVRKNQFLRLLPQSKPDNPKQMNVS